MNICGADDDALRPGHVRDQSPGRVRRLSRVRISSWPMTGFRVAIDTGGTFTDVVAIEEATGATWVTKTPSTPADPSRGLVEGVRKVARIGGFDPGRITAVAHGTTTATNA